MKFVTAVVSLGAALAIGGCEIHPRKTEETAKAAPPATPVLALPPMPQPSDSPLARRIDQAAYMPQPPTPEAFGDLMLKAQVLLDRAHVSPGVIDAQDGENLKNAVAAYERANGLPEDGKLDPEVWARLTADKGPAVYVYAIAPADVAGPFTPAIPEDYAEMAKLPRLGYSGPLEALAERFHMDPALLQALNPGADFGRAGTPILVAAVTPSALPPVTRIEVDKAREQVRAYGGDGRMVAAYPATVGSGDLPTPSGTWAVRAVAPAPTWTYDPSRLNFGDKSTGKVTIAAGPNNPVGAVWIDLTKDTYGLHGTPEPRLVGKTASHGCVRLTNWDAEQLSTAVSKGTAVVFLGEAPQPAPTKL